MLVNARLEQLHRVLAYINRLLCPVRVFNCGIIALNPLIVDELGY